MRVLLRILINTAIHFVGGESCISWKGRGAIRHSADILWATGACLFVRTATYKEVGGLDAGFFAHQEEVDMCWRLRSGDIGWYASHNPSFTMSVEPP